MSTPVEFAPYQCPHCAGSMIAATLVDTHNHSGHGFRNACREVGIKHTRKAIRAFIEGEG